MNMDKYDLAIEKFLTSIEIKEDIYPNYERVNFYLSCLIFDFLNLLL